MPKKKFTFKRRAKKEPVAAVEQPTESAAAQQTAATDVVNTGNHLLIKDINDDQNVLRTAAEYEGKENVIVENLRNCIVLLPFSIKCIYMKNLVNTKIYVGSVSGASFVNEAIDCQIHL